MLVMSGNLRLTALGILFSLFLIDRVLHIGEGEKSITELKGKDINISYALTNDSVRILGYAIRKSKITKESFYLALLTALADRKDIKEILKRLDVDPEEFIKKTEAILGNKSNFTDESYAEVLNNLVLTAYENAILNNDEFIYPRNLLTAALDVKDGDLSRIFLASGLTKKDIELAVVFGKWRKIFGGLRFLPKMVGGFAHRPRVLRHRVMNRAWTAKPTPTLDKFSTDLTDLAREEMVGLLIGHKKEYDGLIQVISRPGKPNALLVGEAGAGKSTIIDHLAMSIIRDDVPEVLFDKRLVSLEMGNLMANATEDVLSARLKEMTDEIIMAGNIVLFVPNIHDLFRTSESSLNAIDIVLPIIRSGSIPVIGETYPREFKEYIEPRTDFLDQFEVVRVEEVTEEEA